MCVCVGGGGVFGGNLCQPSDIFKSIKSFEIRKSVIRPTDIEPLIRAFLILKIKTGTQNIY